jgi:two-component system, NtrC family, sensor kinase
MKNVCILVLYLLATQALNGQQNGADSLKTIEIRALNRKTIDSLQTLLKQQPSNDTNKVVRLFLLSDTYLSDMQYANGLITAANAKALSNELNYAKGEGLYLQAMAEFHKNSTLGFYYSYEAYWLSNTDKTVEQLTNTVAPNYNLEIQKLKEAEPLIESKKDSLSIANIDFALMMNYLQLNQDSIAMQYAERPLRIFKQHNDVLPVFEILRQQMDYFERKGNKAAAKERELLAIKTITGSNDQKTIALIAYIMGVDYYNRSRYGLAIEFLTKSDAALEELGDSTFRIQVFYVMGLTYELGGHTEKAVEYYKRALELMQKTNMMAGAASIYMQIAFPLIKLRKFAEANDYVSKGRALIDSSQDPVDFCRSYDAYGQVLMGKGEYRQAIRMFMIALTVFEKHPEDTYASYIYDYLSQCYQKLGDLKQGLRYAQLSYQSAVQIHWLYNQITSSLQISNVYDEMGQVANAYEYLKIHNKLKDDVQEQDNLNKVADIEIQSILEKSQRQLDVLEKDKKINEENNRNQQLWIIIISGALLSAILVVLILYRNNRQKQKAKMNIEKAYADLKSAQAQLIQSEKMASLGELTAGIAHEIQNPLNFVNNFSEVSNELIDEMNEELEKGDINEAKAIGNDIRQNLEKINHHGKRAGAIVKSMLEHSRVSSGQKEPTDINKLADEYLRLAYHGLRAKDKSFNADFKTNFDETIGKINIIPQDIGRVLLNLFNNAFYAVSKPSKSLKGEQYKPIVSVTTKKINSPSGMGGIEIRVTDNGSGIPKNIIDKIFQPFFTTKPTGSGTGLGLSLSYDIVKAHGGEITVETVEGKGSTFKILLPAKPAS